MFSLKRIIRTIFFIKEKETIRDGINRHIMKGKQIFHKIFLKKYITTNEFKEILEQMGLKEGDTIILHSAWRGCYSLKSTPEDVIKNILDIIGESRKFAYAMLWL